jgi:membrane carboxypeptidase/penicillin-binding protein
MSRTLEEYDEMFTYKGETNSIEIKQGDNVVNLTQDDIAFMANFIAAVVVHVANCDDPAHRRDESKAKIRKKQ